MSFNSNCNLLQICILIQNWMANADKKYLWALVFVGIFFNRDCLC
jgi:hypothetical protein